jgi:hypothetical protein
VEIHSTNFPALALKLSLLLGGIEKGSAFPVHRVSHKAVGGEVRKFCSHLSSCPTMSTDDCGTFLTSFGCCRDQDALCPGHVSMLPTLWCSQLSLCSQNHCSFLCLGAPTPRTLQVSLPALPGPPKPGVQDRGLRVGQG